MSQYFEVHPDNPKPGLLKQAVQLLERGGVLAVPTDSSYALVCHLDDKAASDRLRRIRQVDDKHHLTLLCRDLSELASYAKVDNGPLLATTLIPPGEVHPLNDAQDIRDRFEHDLAGVIDAGACPLEPTTVVDLTPMGTGGEPELVREGRGSLAILGL